MAISVLVTPDNHVQADGRRYILEVYSDAQGECARVEYLAAIGADSTAIANARITIVAAQLADGEAFAALSVDAAPVLRFQTGAQFLQRLRILYRNADQDFCARIARWIIHRIDGGDVTETQLQTVFSLTANQWNTLEAKMRALASDLDAIDQADGE